MDRARFTRQLDEAANEAVAFARSFVHQRLENPVRFFVAPNQSFDGNRTEREAVFPEDSLPDNFVHGPWNKGQVVNFLWREGRVPAWVDVAVCEERTPWVAVRLKCCGRFSDDESLLYYRRGSEASPFGIKSPWLPPDHQKSKKFDLHWYLGRPTHLARQSERAPGTVPNTIVGIVILVLTVIGAICLVQSC